LQLTQIGITNNTALISKNGYKSKNRDVDLPAHTLLAKARETGNPIIGDKTATFIWQGRIAPLLIDDLHRWEEDPQPMRRMGEGLWSLSILLAANAYLEYAFLNPNTGARLPDPLNHKRVWNGIDSYNHFFYMPGSGPSPLVLPGKGVQRGIVRRFQIPTRDTIWGDQRSIILYQPAVSAPVPLVVVFDGPEYLKQGRLNVIVDNLVAAKRVRPFAMAMIQNGRHARNLEYNCSESTLEFVTDSVIPLAQEQLRLTPATRGKWGVLGASLGGLMAVYTGVRYPQVFRKVLSQSGAFSTGKSDSILSDLVRYAPRPNIEIWMNTGLYEGLLESNRQTYKLLKEKQFEVKYHEYPGGHNHTSWRNDIGRGLEELYQ
jgi:enterochelin esterase-like enzyme